MRVVAKVNAQGFYLEDVFVADGAPLPASHIESRPQQGFHRPKWSAASLAWVEGKPAADILTEAKANKEAELRDAADSWYRANVRSFEGAIVTAKYGRSGLTALNAEERAVFDSMNANYQRLKDLIVQTRAATTIAEVEAISWTP
jgi:hypothetical protein